MLKYKMFSTIGIKLFLLMSVDGDCKYFLICNKQR